MSATPARTTTKRPPRAPAPASPADTWTRALAELASAPEGPERERAFVAFAERASGSMPGLARHRDSLLALMRSGLAAKGLVDELAGRPRVLVDEIELPRFVSEDVLAEAGLRGAVRARVLDGELLTASAVSRLVGSTSKNQRQYANRLRSASRLVAVPHRNQYLYPAFQIDEEKGQVRAAAEQVNVMLCASEDPWGVASWWIAPNGRLSGSAPVDLLGSEAGETRLLELAGSLAEDDAA